MSQSELEMHIKNYFAQGGTITQCDDANAKNANRLGRTFCLYKSNSRKKALHGGRRR